MSTHFVCRGCILWWTLASCVFNYDQSLFRQQRRKLYAIYNVALFSGAASVVRLRGVARICIPQFQARKCDSLSQSPVFRLCMHILCWVILPYYTVYTYSKFMLYNLSIPKRRDPFVMGFINRLACVAEFTDRPGNLLFVRGMIRLGNAGAIVTSPRIKAGSRSVGYRQVPNAALQTLLLISIMK